MTTLIIVATILSLGLIASGWALAHPPVEDEPQFARFTNGRDTADGLKAHRSH